MTKRRIKKKHRPIVASVCLALAFGCAAMSWLGYGVAVETEFNGAAMFAHLMCYLWFCGAVLAFELAFEFHIGRRQVSRKRNHPVLSVGAMALAFGSGRLAYEVGCRALESNHFDLAFGFYLAAIWGLTAIAFFVIAIEFNSRRSEG